MKILSIGNSFSEDAQRYLAGVGHSMGLEIKCVNLCIGGCTLVRHYNNMLKDTPDYILQEDGKTLSYNHKLKDILLSDSFDVITIQEASVRSTDYRNFQPYLSELVKYIRDLCPTAKIALHETWGYESHTDRIKNLGFDTHSDMFAAVEATYKKARDNIKPDYLIPSGKVMCALYDEGLKIHRDGFHASHGIGRYAIALTWLKTLTGVSVMDNTFNDFEEEISDEQRQIILRTVEKV